MPVDDKRLKRKRMLIILTILIFGVFLFFCPYFLSLSKGLPPVRTREIGLIPAGIQRASYSFTTPFRRVDKEYWTYRLGIVVPKNETFDLTGQMVLLSESGEQVSIFPINVNSMNTSHWLDGDDYVAYLVGGKTGMEDGKTYELELQFDGLTRYNAAVVMHFLSHEVAK